jgi:spore coat protein U-like protein
VNKLLALLVLLSAATGAGAATVCRIVSAGSVAFGSYDVLSTAPNDSQLNVTVACDRNGGPPGVTVEMALGVGANGTSVNARRMLHVGAPTDYLSYGLYRDVSRSSVWGSTSGINTMTRNLSVPNRGSASTTFTVYGRLPAQQDVSAGSYSDSVQVTVTP